MCETETRNCVAPQKPPGQAGSPRSIQIESAKAAAQEKRQKAIDALQKAMAFCLFFMLCEIVGGYVAHSLAILTDAAHLLTDVAGFGLSIFSLKAAARAACNRYSFGWHRAEVVGTLASLLTMWGLVCVIVFEACNRIYSMYRCSQVDAVPLHPEHLGIWTNLTSTDPTVLRLVLADGTICEAVQAPLMVLIGVLGLSVNMICAGILTMGGTQGNCPTHGHSHSSPAIERREGSPGNKEDEQSHCHDDDHCQDHGSDTPNGGPAGHVQKRGAVLNSAFLHALADCVQSVGVIVAAAVIWGFNYANYGAPSHPTSPYNLADPLSSIFFGVITLYWTRGVMRQVLRVLMESAPDGLDAAAIGAKLAALPGVAEVHHLHIWSLSLEKPSLSVHLVASDKCATLQRAQEVCESFGIVHHTIQVDCLEVGSDRCDADLGCVEGTSPAPSHGS